MSAEYEGQGSGHPTCSWGSAGPEWWWAQSWGPAWLGGGDPGGCGSGNMDEGWVSGMVCVRLGA
jgi:hypothetical protein